MKKIKIHKEGYGILTTVFIVLVLINILVWYESDNRTWFLVNLIVTILAYGYVMFFFRNPSRVVEVDDNNMIIAPADGRICVIEPTEEYEYFEGKKMMQVSIFMSLISVHANWYPITGKILYSKHHKGRHIAAYLPKSSSENERSTTVIECANGEKILIRQVAGALARRIVTYAAPGHDCSINEHLGFIKLGSRVDMFLPIDSQIYVEIGESMRGNETIIARIPDSKA